MTGKTKVLVVEDNAVNAKLLTVFLEEADFEAVLAEDPHIALDKMKTQRDIGVILLDRMMPNMDGLDALKLFKKLDMTWHIPIIMLTAALSPQQISEATLIGAYACLPKPFDKEKIISTIKSALEDGRR